MATTPHSLTLLLLSGSIDQMATVQTAGKRIEICGGIGSGKTTLARALAVRPNIKLVLEQFRDNPFWALAYTYPNLYTSEKNLCFIAQHSGAIKAAPTEDLAICDFAAFQDLAYAALSKEEGHLEIMKVVFKHLHRGVPPPSLLIHLKCGEDIQLERIRSRGIKEEQSITRAFLVELNGRIQFLVGNCNQGVPVLELNSERLDFSKHTSSTKDSLEKVFSILGES